jgi:uncharacterized protein YggE
MSRRFVLLAAALGVLIVVSSPAAAQQPTQQAQTITATGTGQTRVVPKNRHNNASIVTAVNSARKASIAGALREAHEYALSYAKAVGLKLGTVITVSDVQSNGYFGPGGPFGFGPFGPNQYCGTIRQLIGRPVRGKKPKFKKVHRCIVPRFAYTTLTVTYSAS